MAQTPRKIRRDSRTYQQLRNSLALSVAPPIYPCSDCGGPVIRGYCCERCGSRNPEGV